MSKTRCSGTMTEAQYLAWIRSALRSKWLRWPPRAEALKAAQVPYKGSNKLRKFSYQCALCKGLFAQKDCQVDHYPHDAGSILSVDDIGQFVNRLYCETTNLRVLCTPCHSVYTLSQRAGISFEAATVQKKVTEFLKSGKQEVLDFCQARGYSSVMLTNDAKRRAALTEIFAKETNS